MRIHLPLLAAAISVVGAYHASANCFSLAAHEPHRLSGHLHYVLFAGPPNYKDVQKGDTPEPSYVLRLQRPVCLAGDEFADPTKYFSNVQIMGDESTTALLKANVGRFVTIALRDPMAASTGHHHEPLVAWATEIISESLPQARAKPLDFVDEYGGPATPVRTFYEVLRDGRGEIASKMIIHEKRG